MGTIPDQTIATGQTATLEIVSYFNDPDGGALTYTAATNAAATNAAAVVAVAVAGGTLTLVGVTAGTASVTVKATDPAGLTAAQGFRVTVETPNRSPEAVGTIPARTLTVGQSATLDVSPFVTDPDGDALTYTAATSAAGVVSVTVSGSVLTLVGVTAGTASVTVTAADPDGLTAGLSFGVTVETVAPHGFQIELVFVTAVTETQKAVFARAAERWMTILAPTELDDRPARRRYCGSDPRFERFAAIDDLMIVVSVEAMAGGTLAVASPCWTRGPAGLPSYGYMRFNSASIDELEATGRLERLVSHEIAHVLGLGTIWEALGLIENPASEETSPDTHFVGPLAIAAFDDAGGTGYAGAKVPVENTGGLGTKNGHWREAVFGDELMTGWFYGRPKPLSAITIQSLADLGYAVDMTAADSYRLPAADAAAALGPARRIPYGDDVGRGPIVVEGPDGRIMRVIPDRGGGRPRRN
ncbi:leishmanolysin-related zinc metalloendopeptidase [Candidatus Palauibacter sp.]|uniref:leishmanolysin-related zinc metalloendopeptidase n=1 Tax=Candidatus Palauibacter sp. TaxID=3101350 RepID=UPI003B029ED7